MAKKKKCKGTSLYRECGRPVNDLLIEAKEAQARLKEQEEPDDATYIRIPRVVVKTAKIVGGVAAGAAALAGAFAIGKAKNNDWEEDESFEEGTFEEMANSGFVTEETPEE